VGIKNRQAVARDCQEWRKIVWEAKVRNGLYCLRGRRKRRKQEEDAEVEEEEEEEDFILQHQHRHVPLKFH
jgi:hypothetical protein